MSETKALLCNRNDNIQFCFIYVLILMGLSLLPRYWTKHTFIYFGMTLLCIKLYTSSSVIFSISTWWRCFWWWWWWFYKWIKIFYFTFLLNFTNKKGWKWKVGLISFMLSYIYCSNVYKKFLVSLYINSIV